MNERLLFSRAVQEDRRYWRRKLRDAPPPAGLPPGGPPGDRQERTGPLHLAIDGETGAAFTRLTRGSPRLGLLAVVAAVKAVLFRYGGGERIAVGVPVQAGLDGGDATDDAIVLLDEIRAGMPFRELLRGVRETAREAEAHGRYPLRAAVADLGLAAAGAACPLFAVAVRHAALHGAMPALGQAVEISVDATADGATLTIDCDRRRVAGGQAEAFARHLGTLLAAALADVTTPLGRLAMLDANERRRALESCNRTERPYPTERCLHHLVEARADRDPTAPALSLGGESLSYGEVERRANLLASRLLAEGVRPDDVVAVALPRGRDLPVALLAAMKAGAACLPLDLSLPAARLALMLADAGPAALIAEAGIDVAPLGFRGALLQLDGAASWPAGTAARPAPPVGPENLAYVLYTSGSTGRPKGVSMPHRALVNLVAWQLAAAGDDTAPSTLQFATIGFDVAFQEIFATWAGGGRLVMIPQEAQRSAEALLRQIAEQRVERLFLPYVALQQMAAALEGGQAAPATLREVITAGEQLRVTPTLARMFRRLPDCRLHNHYGPTESHVVSAHRLTGPPSRWPALPPIGRPIANARLYVLDEEMSPVADGVPGELYIGGLALARGYLNAAGATAERFLPDPFGPRAGGRLYRTGDIARRRPDGELEFLGRRDGQVKVQGMRVEIGEVEANLAGHPDLDDAVVLAESGPQGTRLVAYVTARPGRQPDASELSVYLRARLPAPMVPAGFVLLQRFPLTASGKVDRRALPKANGGTLESALPRLAPRSPLEARIVEMWREILGLGEIGVRDNFFELGGNSLAATRVIARIRKEFEVELPERRIFEFPTIEQLAAQLDAVRAAAGGPDQASR